MTSPADTPRYAAVHDGARARVLKRCPDETCYAPFAEMASIADAKELAYTLNRAEKP